MALIDGPKNILAKASARRSAVKPEVESGSVQYVGRISRAEFEAHAKDPQVQAMMDDARAEHPDLDAAKTFVPKSRG